MSYQETAAAAGKQASPIEMTLKILEEAISRLEERGSVLEARLAPVLQNPQLKVARITGAPERPDVPHPPTSLVVNHLRTLAARVVDCTDRLEAITRSLDL